MSTQRSARAVCAAVVVAFYAWITTSALAADQAPQGGSAGKSSAAERREKTSLDDELLKDLGPDPTIDGDTNGLPQRTKPKSPKDWAADALDQELLKGIGDGDDLGMPGEDDPLAQLNAEMREVESLIARHRADAQTQQRQAQIVRKLDDLIREAQKQRQGGKSSSASGSSGKGAQQTSSSRDVSQPKKESGQSQPSADEPAQDSTKQMREERARKPDMADMRDVLKGVWGQLPERQREQMLQSYEEQFLPKYEQMIADYFRSLAEEQRRKP